MPKSEKKLDIEALYVPLPQQARFHQSPAKYRLYGGAVGGGKSHALIFEAILRCLKYDFPVTGAIFRRSFPELDATVIKKMREILPSWFYRYNQQQHVMTFVTGDRIEFGYAEKDSDVTRYQSREWDWLAIDELTHFTEYRFTYLMSRVRTTKPLNTKFFAGTNPGDVGHVWVKERWVDKNSTSPGYNPDEYDFIPAKIHDNVHLMEADPDYILNLEMLPENEKKALLYGDWDVFEGQFFSEWDPTRHTFHPFDVPENWEIIMGWDDGSRAPRSVHLYAIDNDNRVWVIWEYYKEKEELPDAARNIQEELKSLGLWDRITKLVVDPSMKRKNNHSGLSSIEILEGMGFGFKWGNIELGNNNRVEGWRVMKSYLAHKPYEEPLLKVSTACPEFIRTIPSLVYYKSKESSNKKEDLDTTMEDHAADDCRYVLVSLDSAPSRFSKGHSYSLARRNYDPRSS